MGCSAMGGGLGSDHGIADSVILFAFLGGCVSKISIDTPNPLVKAGVFILNCVTIPIGVTAGAIVGFVGGVAAKIVGFSRRIYFKFSQRTTN